ncbi:MAG: hypothetical protein ACLFVU_03640 [Phycisphaerae bacterium]
MKRTALVLLTSAVVCTSAIELPAAEDKTQRRPRVMLSLKDGKPVRGLLVRADDSEVVLRVGEEEKSFANETIKPVSLYMVKRKVLDLSEAESHIRLAKLCMRHGLKTIALRELSTAQRLDPERKEEIARLRKQALSSTPPEAEEPEPAESDEGAADEKTVRQYKEATKAQIAVFRKQAEAKFEAAKKFAPSMHLIETPHFLIYSTWDKDNDKALANICENMYARMCRQFNIPAKENIWAGKCPVYVFWKPENFQRFATEIDKNAAISKAAGYNRMHSNGFTYIVMNRLNTKSDFFTVLVHEASHAFLARYLTNRHVTSWVNEGLAEYMAATLVKDGFAMDRCKLATKEAAKGERSIMPVFDGVKLDSFDYGVAQSLTRYLISRDKKAYIKFIQLQKQGKSDEEALKEAYGITREQLARLWFKAIR